MTKTAQTQQNKRPVNYNSGSSDSSNNNNNEANMIVASKNERLDKYFHELFLKARSQTENRLMRTASKFGIQLTMDELKSISDIAFPTMLKQNNNDADDDKCKSPAKKKQKSASPTNQKQQQKQQPTRQQQQPPTLDPAIERRLNGMKKANLCDELELLGFTDYKKSWTRKVLIETALGIHLEKLFEANKQQQQQQQPVDDVPAVEDPPKQHNSAPPEPMEVVNEDINEVLEKKSSTSKQQQQQQQQQSKKVSTCCSSSISSWSGIQSVVDQEKKAATTTTQHTTTWMPKKGSVARAIAAKEQMAKSSTPGKASAAVAAADNNSTSHKTGTSGTTDDDNMEEESIEHIVEESESSNKEPPKVENVKSQSFNDENFASPSKSKPCSNNRSSPSDCSMSLVQSAKKKFEMGSILSANSAAKKSPCVNRIISSDQTNSARKLFQASQTNNTGGGNVVQTSSNSVKTAPLHARLWPNKPISSVAKSGPLSTLSESKDVNKAKAFASSSQKLKDGIVSETKQCEKEARKAQIQAMREKSKLNQLKSQTNKAPESSSSTQKFQTSAHQKLSKFGALKQMMHSKPTPATATNNIQKKEEVEVFDTYDMTDIEDCEDSDVADTPESQKSRGKHIPLWARKENLQKQMEIQLASNYQIDPDELFGEIETCNLEAIFGFQGGKYRGKRKSSGNWSQHRVTEEEKLAYKFAQKA